MASNAARVAAAFIGGTVAIGVLATPGVAHHGDSAGPEIIEGDVACGQLDDTLPGHGPHEELGNATLEFFTEYPGFVDVQLGPVIAEIEYTEEDDDSFVPEVVSLPHDAEAPFYSAVILQGDDQAYVFTRPGPFTGLRAPGFDPIQSVTLCGNDDEPATVTAEGVCEEGQAVLRYEVDASGFEPSSVLISFDPDSWYTEYSYPGTVAWPNDANLEPGTLVEVLFRLGWYDRTATAEVPHCDVQDEEESDGGQESNAQDDGTDKEEAAADASTTPTLPETGGTGGVGILLAAGVLMIAVGGVVVSRRSLIRT